MSEPPKLKIVFLPHALRRMEERRISEEEARTTLEEPDLEYSDNLGRTVAERVFPNNRLATRVVYNLGVEDERVVITVERGRPAGGETR